MVALGTNSVANFGFGAYPACVPRVRTDGRVRFFVRFAVRIRALRTS